ncbi:MAG: hypothetical protein JW724_04625, partial [Candidatus Altiarchaeota archaeon]|nr:hypothetical protein [Candidatus Altiarchaeota archaeon]
MNKNFLLYSLVILGVMATIALTATSPLAASVQSQTQPAAPEVRPALLGQPMPEFSLPSLQGPEVSLAGLKGKNVMIVFPRGYAAE